jgi:hypothetical protein
VTTAHETAAHVDEGTLRRMYDEPATLPAAARAHYDTCSTCQETLRRVAAVARDTAVILSNGGAEVDTMHALSAIRARLDAPAPRRAGWWKLGRTPGGLAVPRRQRWVYGGAVTAVVAGLTATLTATGAAQGALSVFQPKSVTTVAVAPSDLRGLPDLSAYGTMSWTSTPRLRAVADKAAAATDSGLAVPVVSSLPAGVPSDPSYFVLDRSTGSFTFRADQARSAATQNGSSLPAMPPGLDGSIISVDLGPGVAVVYGGSLPGTGRGREGRTSQLPSLVVGEVRAPSVTSSGASLQQIEDYLLSLPGISQTLAAEIRAIGDPASTLPIPIPVDRFHGHSVRIGGVDGVAVGDNTGVGSVVIWQQRGIIYAVGGMLTENQVLAIAGALG